LGIDYQEVDLTKHLEAVDAYNKRDNIVLRYFDPTGQAGIASEFPCVRTWTGSSMPPLHYLVVQDENGEQICEERIRLKDYTQWWRATISSNAQRALQLYYFADYYNYAVAGTTNRDEMLLGFS